MEIQSAKLLCKKKIGVATITMNIPLFLLLTIKTGQCKMTYQILPQKKGVGVRVSKGSEQSLFCPPGCETQFSFRSFSFPLQTREK